MVLAITYVSAVCRHCFALSLHHRYCSDVCVYTLDSTSTALTFDVACNQTEHDPLPAGGGDLLSGRSCLLQTGGTDHAAAPGVWLQPCRVSDSTKHCPTVGLYSSDLWISVTVNTGLETLCESDRRRLKPQSRDFSDTDEVAGVLAARWPSLSSSSEPNGQRRRSRCCVWRCVDLETTSTTSALLSKSELCKTPHVKGAVRLIPVKEWEECVFNTFRVLIPWAQIWPVIRKWPFH